MKASVFIATSLDGYIARENGDLDWLPADDGASSADDHGYAAFVAGVDALVMGRRTYEKVLGFGFWPYDNKPVIVLTRAASALPTPPAPSVEVMSGSPAEIVERLAARGFQHLYVDGGATVQGFLRAGLIHRLIITRIPILLGKGIPLFAPQDGDIKLRHVATRTYPSGLVQSEYEVGSTSVTP